MGTRMSCVRFASRLGPRESAGSWGDSASFGKNNCAGWKITAGRCASNMSTRHWAGPRKWKALAPQCSEFVRAQLIPVMEQIRAAKAQRDHLSQQIEALVAQEKIPAGLGALTVSLIEGEVCDWTRFSKRKAVGSYTGCCPSEHSSGGVQRFGAIDRHGNKHLRVLLVEAVWRLLRWQPHWHARQKYLQKLKHGASLKKQIAVALAAQLAIDL